MTLVKRFVLVDIRLEFHFLLEEEAVLEWDTSCRLKKPHFQPQNSLILLIILEEAYLKLSWRPLISIDGSTIYELDKEFKVRKKSERNAGRNYFICLISKEYGQSPKASMMRAWARSHLDEKGYVKKEKSHLVFLFSFSQSIHSLVAAFSL